MLGGSGQSFHNTIALRDHKCLPLFIGLFVEHHCLSKMQNKSEVSTILWNIVQYCEKSSHTVWLWGRWRLLLVEVLT